MSAAPGGFGGLWQRLRGQVAAGEVPVRSWNSLSSGTPPRWVGFDETLAWVIAGLISLGLVMVYSASIQLPDSPKYTALSPLGPSLAEHCIGITPFSGSR